MTYSLRFSLCALLLLFVRPSGAEIAMLPVDISKMTGEQLIEQLAQMPKDPNMAQEFEHVLYWMGDYRRCNVELGGKKVSVMGMMALLQKSYQHFKDIAPNTESLFLLASLPSDFYSQESSAAAGVHRLPMDHQIMFACRKDTPVPIMEWVMPELKRYRAERLLQS